MGRPPRLTGSQGFVRFASPYTRTPMPEIAAPRGTRDILPDEFAARRWLLETHREVVESFGYRPIETPLIESTELFSRGGGADTDVVEKQMFTFQDRGGRSLTLRPEGTAGTLRAVLGAHLDQEVRPVRVHYAGPFFRAERPQAGRQHQFTQVGVECIGERSSGLDAEIIEVAWRFFEALGITGIQLQVNSLGGPEDRARYRAALVAYYTPLEASLCDDCRRRLHTNPLRLLDCKRDAGLVAAAPLLWDSLDRASRGHFTAVLRDLEAAGIDAIRHDRVHGVRARRRADPHGRARPRHSSRHRVGGRRARLLGGARPGGGGRGHG